jgi:hypothetical protein
VYDLKGSTINRRSKGESSVKLDEDFQIAEEKFGHLKNLRLEDRSEIIDRLDKDIKFFVKLKIMDYSVFLVKMSRD